MDTSTTRARVVGGFRGLGSTYLQFEPVRAFRAAKILGANPDDLPQVFTIIESFSMDSLARSAKRLRESETGRRLLSDKPDIVELLADREALARLPEGSLGRAYLAFVEEANISADGIRAAAKEGMKHSADIPEPLNWIHARMRDTHDLWHAATGYSSDVLGESALLAFIFAQTWNPGVALILIVALTKTLQSHFGDGVAARQTIYDGFRRGSRAAWLPGQEWEELLAMPVDEVRRRLNLGAPPVYRKVSSEEIKASIAAA